MRIHVKHFRLAAVAPHAGAWIEIPTSANVSSKVIVAPHAGAWIEISTRETVSGSLSVAPHAGAWIEMLLLELHVAHELSRPTRARGLKFNQLCGQFHHGHVAPHAGAWIEMAHTRLPFRLS